MNRFLMATLGLMIASPAMSADFTPSFPSGGINPSHGIYGGMITGLTVMEPGAYAPSDLPVTLSIDGNQSGERASASVTAYTAVSARVASAGSGCPAGSIYSYGTTGTKIIVSDGNGLSGSTVSVVSGGTGNASAIPANPVSMTAAKSSCTPPKLNLSWGVQSVSLDNQGWGYASPPSGTGSVSMAPDAAIALVGTAVQTGVVSLPDKLVAASRVGAAGGVAGLDGSGNVTSPISSANITAGSPFGGTAYPSVYIGHDMSALLGSPLYGDHMIQIGGAPVGNVSGSPAGYWTSVPQNLLVGAVTDGPYNNACALCLFTAPGYQNTLLAEIAGEDFTNKSIPAFDMAGIFWNAGQQPFRLIEAAASYTATSVTLSTKLNDQQLLLIHQGEYIVTNSLLPGKNNTTGGSTIPSPDMEVGIIKSVDNTGDKTVINVYNWGAMLSKGSTDVPDGGSLETYYFGGYSSPAVFIGAGTKMFGFNTMMAYDGNSTGDDSTKKATSITRNLEWGEVDFNVSNVGKPHSVSIHGLTFGGSSPSVTSSSDITDLKTIYTPESYLLYLGGIYPHHLEIGDVCGNMAIETSQLYLPSTCSLFSETTPLGSVYDFDMLELHQIIGGYNERMVMHIRSDGVSTSDYTHATLRFGPRINGIKGTTSSNDTASLLGEIDFPGNNGGVNLCGYGSNCGLKMDGSGNVEFSGSVTVYGNITENSGLSVSGQLTAKSNFVVRGTQYYQTSDGSNQILVVPTTDKAITFQTTAGTGGKVIFKPDVTFSGNVALPSFTLTSLPTSGVVDGSERWCSNCKLKGILGVAVYWHSSASKWTDSQNNDLTTN